MSNNFSFDKQLAAFPIIGARIVKADDLSLSGGRGVIVVELFGDQDGEPVTHPEQFRLEVTNIISDCIDIASPTTKEGDSWCVHADHGSLLPGSADRRVFRRRDDGFDAEIRHPSCRQIRVR